MICDWLSRPALNNHLRITDSQRNQTYTHVAVSKECEVWGKVAEHLSQLSTGEIRSIKCFDGLANRII